METIDFVERPGVLNLMMILWISLGSKGIGLGSREEEGTFVAARFA